MVARSGADSDYRDNGNLTVAVHSSQHAGLARKQELFGRYGLHATRKSRSELDDMGIPPFVTASVDAPSDASGKFGCVGT